MSYAADPQRLARLLRDLATGLVAAGTDPSGSSSIRLLAAEALTAARGLEEPPPLRKPGRLVCF
ncbi:hypothetical protein ACWCWD_06450 [Streptomyces sp. NPDC001493]